MTWLDTEGNRDWQADAQELLEQDVFGSGVIMSDEFFPDAPLARSGFLELRL